MNDRTTAYTCKVRLFGPVDGQEIEDFIDERQLRSSYDDVYTTEHTGKFKSGTGYVTICVAAASARFGAAAANQIAEQFGGDLI